MELAFLYIFYILYFSNLQKILLRRYWQFSIFFEVLSKVLYRALTLKTAGRRKKREVTSSPILLQPLSDLVWSGIDTKDVILSDWCNTCAELSWNLKTMADAVNTLNFTMNVECTETVCLSLLFQVALFVGEEWKFCEAVPSGICSVHKGETKVCISFEDWETPYELFHLPTLCLILIHPTQPTTLRKTFHFSCWTNSIFSMKPVYNERKEKPNQC